MDDVIENCATTFEEDGVNQQTLDDIRKVGIPFPSSSTFKSSRHFKPRVIWRNLEIFFSS